MQEGTEEGVSKVSEVPGAILCLLCSGTRAVQVSLSEVNGF